MAVDPNSGFANARLPTDPAGDWVLTKVGADPTVLISTDFPLAIGQDGNLYYPPRRSGDLQILRTTPSGNTSTFATLPRTAAGAPLENIDGITVAPDGVFTFPTTLLSGAAYAVTVASDPILPWQTCIVTSGTGTVTTGNVTSVAVNCTTNDYVVNVSVTGLLGSGLVLRNNGGDDLAIVGDGTVAFATGVASSTDYDVTVQTAPAGPTQTCTITGGSGTISNNHVTVGVACATSEYTVGSDSTSSTRTQPTAEAPNSGFTTAGKPT